jgi:hypothetical protein
MAVVAIADDDHGTVWGIRYLDFSVSSAHLGNIAIKTLVFFQFAPDG